MTPKRTNHTRAEALRIVHTAPTGTWFYVTVTPSLPTLGAPIRTAPARGRFASVRISRVTAKGVINDLLRHATESTGITLETFDLPNGTKTIYIGG